MRALVGANLSETERRAVAEAASVLKSELPVARVLLFGSRARGEGTPDSDIDLLILTACEVTPRLRRSISDHVFDINVRNDVVLRSLVASLQDWREGAASQMLIHGEVERDGCEL